MTCGSIDRTFKVLFIYSGKEEHLRGLLGSQQSDLSNSIGHPNYLPPANNGGTTNNISSQNHGLQQLQITNGQAVSRKMSCRSYNLFLNLLTLLANL